MAGKQKNYPPRYRLRLRDTSIGSTAAASPRARFDIGFPNAVFEHYETGGFLLIMLVFDLPDDFLDHVLDGQQPLGAAEFIDDDRQMHSLATHPRKQFQHSHRFGDEQGRSKEAADRTVERRILVCDEHVLDVDHTNDMVERIGVDRKAAVPGIREGGDQGDDEIVSGTAISHSGHRDLAAVCHEVQKIAKHLPLMWAESP